MNGVEKFVAETAEIAAKTELVKWGIIDLSSYRLDEEDQ